MKCPGFLKDKWFYISIATMVLLLFGAMQFSFGYLDIFTRHGQEITVPDMVGMNYDEAVERYGDDFRFQLLDSIYVKNFPEGAVYQQNPNAGLKVKKGRNLYIVHTSIAPETVVMPNLRNLSLRQAMVSLKGAGLKVDKLEYVDYFARNAVVEQKFDNDVVEPNTVLVKGSSITLVVGLGSGDKMTYLPDLVGVSINDVKDVLNNASLNIGNEIFIDTRDMGNLFVSRTDPEFSYDAMVPLGSKVNVWFKSDMSFDFKWYRQEKYRRDSTVEVLRRKKVEPEIIKYVIDSFDYILKYRKFSYDSAQREADKKLRFYIPEKEVEIDTVFYDDIDLFDDNDFYYDE
ncbi:MAG: PASTA domain-containing protein [Candidatus Limimorpha sp.]